MNYRKTAEILNMTQPAVTQHIHYLEEEYGCKLFLYDKRTLSMTPEAILFRKYAENLILLLSEGKIDFALIEGLFDRSRFASKLYRNEHFVGLCGANHPFADRTVSLDEIWNEHLILREEGSGTRNILAQLLSSMNHSFNEFRQITTINSFGLITSLLENNKCITFAYRAVGECNKTLAKFRVEGFDITREFNYIYLDTPYSKQAVSYFDGFRM